MTFWGENAFLMHFNAFESFFEYQNTTQTILMEKLTQHRFQKIWTKTLTVTEST